MFYGLAMDWLPISLITPSDVRSFVSGPEQLSFQGHSVLSPYTKLALRMAVFIVSVSLEYQFNKKQAANRHLSESAVNIIQ